MLRRQLLDWLRPHGTVHTYLGPAPAGYAEGLRLAGSDVVYRGFPGWYAAAVRAAVRGPAAYVFKPGEIQLTLPGMKEHLSVLPLLGLLRARGGRIIRVGSGARSVAALPRLLVAPSVRAAHLLAWRDADTADYLGRGAVMPDLAFGEGRPSDQLGDAGRDRLVVSLRGDRPLPGSDWFAGVSRLAERHRLRPIAVVQVGRDRVRARELAARLDAELADWDGTGHDRQERRLRATYAGAALVLSDRLHVLIAGLTEGAAPSAAVGPGSAKVERHFAAAGLSGVTVDVGRADATGVAAVLQAALDRRDAALAALAVAREQLAEVRAAVGRVLDEAAR